MEQTHNKMKGFFNPLWIVITIVIPNTILTGIYFQLYSIIKSQLEKNEQSAWIIFCLSLLAIATGYLVYAVIVWVKKLTINFFLPIAILLTHISYLYVMGIYIERLLPFGKIPDYVITGDLFLIYTGTFIIPSLFYALMVGVSLLDKYLQKQRIWTNFIAVVAIPVGWYFLYTMVMTPFYDITHTKFGTHAVIFMFIIGCVAFYFFLVRAMFLIYKHKTDFIKKFRILWTILFAIVFPLLGLLLNEMYFPFNLIKPLKSIGNFHMLFGNLSHPLFFILTIVNGMLLLVPAFEHKMGRLLLFIARLIMYPFAVYFFILFIPYYPLFLIGILLFGTGIFIISPLLLMVVHSTTLKNDFRYLKEAFKVKKLILIIAIACLIIPSILIGKFLIEKHNLFKALEYVYYPNYGKTKKMSINHRMLAKTLESVNVTKEERGFFGDDSRRIPFITEIYNKVVLDNLTLSDKKITLLRRIFLDEVDNGSSRDDRRPPLSVRLSDLKHATTYDNQTKLFHTMIDLELTNGDRWNSEYLTYITLPPGAWINDYYLYVFGEKRQGMLAEKKATLWIYQQITRRRRDPGLMYYVDNDTVALRVFPFNNYEVRKTGFEIVHMEPISLTLDNKQINTKGNYPDRPLFTTDQKAVFLSQTVKKGLPKTRRTPYYHFIIDCSERAVNDKQSYITAVRLLQEKQTVFQGNAKVSLVGSQVTTFALDDDFESRLLKHRNQGGFFIDRALKQLYYQHYHAHDDTYPIPVIVSFVPDGISLADDYDQFAFTFPDTGGVIYTLSGNGELFENSLFNYNPYSIEGGDFTLDVKDVYVFNHKGNKYYLADDEKSTIVNLTPMDFTKPSETVAVQSPDALMTTGSLLQYYVLHPEKTDKVWKAIYYQSIKHHVLTPLTSFVVLENETQQIMLLKKQKAILNAKKFLDAGEEMEEIAEMPEPSFFIMLALFVVILMIRRFGRRVQKADI